MYSPGVAGPHTSTSEVDGVGAGVLHVDAGRGLLEGVSWPMSFCLGVVCARSPSPAAVWQLLVLALLAI